MLVIGAPGVGKSSLISQFMTSEYLHAYDTSIGKQRKSVTFFFVHLFFVQLGHFFVNLKVFLIIFVFLDDDSGEKSVSVLLAGEESELVFLDHTCGPSPVIFTI